MYELYIDDVEKEFKTILHKFTLLKLLNVVYKESFVKFYRL